MLSIPAPLAWSLLDFQTPVDFFVFLPYVVAGFAWLLAKGKSVIDADAARALSPVSLAAAIAFITLFAASMYRLRADGGLPYQRQAVAEIEALRGQSGPILTVHAPEFLALTQRTSPVRLLVLVPSGGLASLIHATYPTGFGGLIDEIERFRPQTVLVGYIEGKGLAPLELWLDENFEVIRQSPWRVYARK